MSNDVGLFEAIYTQRAIRYLKSDPIPEDLILKLIESATKAPSGTNSQPWKFIVIRDPILKRSIKDYYINAWESSYGRQASSTQKITSRIRKSATHLAEHMDDVPVLILVCIEHDGSSSTMLRGASIYPAVQNLLLAARGLGLGSALTTLHKKYEHEIKELLGIPNNVETAALIPIGYPDNQTRYGATKRFPVKNVTYYDRWDTVPKCHENFL